MVNWPSYKKAHLIGKVIPWLATEFTTLMRRDQKRDIYWNTFASSLYGSFLGGLKLIASLPDGSRVLIRPFSEDTTIIRDIFERKVYEVYHCPLPGDTVIDVGAHIGLFSIRAQKLVGSRGLVIAVEPCPENYKLLEANIRLLRLGNIVPVRTALGDREGFTNLFLSRGKTVGHSIIMKRKTSVKVPVTTLDRLCMKLGVGHVEFIKINAEGAEYEILKEAENTLKSNDVMLSMTMHGKAVRRKVIDILKRLGYSITELKTGKRVYEAIVYAWRQDRGTRARDV